MSHDQQTQTEFDFLPREAEDVGHTGPLPSVRRETVSTSDGDVSALVWGDTAPEVVFLHGAGLNAHTWDGTLLALGVPAIALDLPGHGDSAWRDDADYRPSTIATAAAEGATALLAESTELDDASAGSAASGDAASSSAGVVLVGQSLGGLTASVIAASHPRVLAAGVIDEQAPALVRALVIVDISPGLDASTGASQVRDFLAGPADFGSRDEIVDRAIAFGFGPTRDDVSRGVFLNTRVKDDGRVIWKHHFANLGGLAPIAATSFAPIWDDLAQVTVPVLLIAGTRGVLSEEQRAEFQERLPEATVVTIESGHNIQEDAPVALADTIRDFIGGLPA
ncbi:alpha/beta fold hydrolase [Plantibacter sp. YIM 135249]|uniref:alpha/beta fold hydrolase n=1 Tax=Plantibacter sp. YIM 135249 TaxID=3423918 RepID=UPI003D334B3A